MHLNGKNDSESLDRLMNSLKIKLTKLTKNRGDFADCMARSKWR